MFCISEQIPLSCILESVSIIFITLPILFPLITPPVGMNLFVLQGISPDSKMTDIIKSVIPFGAAMALEIVILCFFPEVATWLPSVVK